MIDYKGSTYYAVGLALVRIVGAILRNQHSVLTVSTVLNGEYGLENVALSVPCIVSQEGIDLVMEASLPPLKMQPCRNPRKSSKMRSRNLRTMNDVKGM